MPISGGRLGLSLAGIAFASFALVIMLHADIFRELAVFHNASMLTFKTMFVSIVLEAFPFILLGVLVSSILEVFVPDRFVQKLIPRNPAAGVAVSCLLGLIFPICECGMIPVARRLVRKGMPLYSAVVFLLAGPIINPVVFASTFMAFRSRPEIAYSRMGLAFAVAAAVGLIVYRWVRMDPLKPDGGSLYDHDHHHHHSHPNHNREHHRQEDLGHSRSHEHSHGNQLFAAFDHASGEFFDMGKYLIFGALLTALIQTFVDRSSLTAIGQSEWASHWFMISFAYLLSICSTSDAFVASSFTSTFSDGSLLAFLVFGPMLDLKGTLMMLSVFKARFVALIAVLVLAAVTVGTFLIGQFIL